MENSDGQHKSKRGTVTDSSEPSATTKESEDAPDSSEPSAKTKESEDAPGTLPVKKSRRKRGCTKFTKIKGKRKSSKKLMNREGSSDNFPSTSQSTNGFSFVECKMLYPEISMMNEDTSDISSVSENNLSTRNSKKRKLEDITSLLELERLRLEDMWERSCQNQEGKDPDIAFFQDIISTISKLDKHKNLQFKIGILQLLLQIKKNKL